MNMKMILEKKDILEAQQINTIDLKNLENKLEELTQNKMEKKTNKNDYGRLIHIKEVNKSQCMYNWHF